VRKVLGVALVAALMMVVLLLDAHPVVAKPDYTRRTGKDCPYCHTPGGYNLNDAGKYYRDHNHSLKGYEPEKPKPSH
jgi:hypothetical protein